jgi:hypothetical protein
MNGILGFLFFDDASLGHCRGRAVKKPGDRGKKLALWLTEIKPRRRLAFLPQP